ncbi:Glycerophosphodiester phosphodiesterase GDPD2 [Hibiscus syriacus]|uniref:glycerophosphodiester phosphodiesterase n=1 Tax=Hibiscus syriacus TaxID=106335 RepID=A0A6A2YNG2_HIBSY|nr:glycerophosphodiester phosphodiesterase GDPD1, chloroplastic-like [Hibiscus syriacus]KAE8680863.1 Glycerophosphodiester phosphodiesterase GDPD2 [Hibiscus syriacus]
MALKAVNVSDVPNIDQVPENNASLYSSRFNSEGMELNVEAASFTAPKFLVIGHRGHGMNIMQSSDSRMEAIKENTILSFNSAAKFPIDFIEFDVQVTKDDCPVIFHDDFLFSQENGTVYEKRVTDMLLEEFLCFGPQREAGKQGKCLLRKSKDGKILNWNVQTDDSFCTLVEAFRKVDSSLGFNIELKFDDNIVYNQDHLTHVLQVILQVVSEYAKDRPIIFSSFHPDAAQLVRKLQNTYPVFFLTNGGTQVYYDVRRNSLEEAIKVCLEGGLQGIVSEIKGVFRNPGAVPKIKEAKLSLLTYGRLNNVPEAVCMQHLMGIDGVIVDFVQEISHAVDDMIVKPLNESLKGGNEEQKAAKSKVQFSQQELSFLLKLIPELIQH